MWPPFIVGVLDFPEFGVFTSVAPVECSRTICTADKCSRLTEGVTCCDRCSVGELFGGWIGVDGCFLISMFSGTFLRFVGESPREWARVSAFAVAAEQVDPPEFFVGV